MSRKQESGTALRSGLSRRTWLGAAALALGSSVRAQPGPHPLRLLLVTGGHDHEPSIYAVFDGADGMKVTVDPHPGAFRRDVRSDYDAAVLYDMVQISDVDERRRGNLQRFVESGKGMVILHHALCSFNSWEWWWKDVAGVRYLPRAEEDRPASTFRHDEMMKLMRRGDHPVLYGVNDTEFRDETYGQLWLAPSNKVLLVTDNPTSDGPVAWVSAYDKSRVVVIQPGHGREAHEHKVFRRLVHNAVRWSAGR